MHPSNNQNQMIPRLIHQTWRTIEIPEKWKPFVEKVQELNPGWSYKLWTDKENLDFVKNEFPEFFPIFFALPRPILKADIIRYLLMYKLGGVYLDLDYEVLRPFDFGNNSLILSKEESGPFSKRSFTNCILASVPGHNFWADVINDLQKNPPFVPDHTLVEEATGPIFLSRIYHQKSYSDIYTPDRIYYLPQWDNKETDFEKIRNNGISIGIHHGWGTWRRSTIKEWFTVYHIRRKLRMILYNMKRWLKNRWF